MRAAHTAGVVASLIEHEVWLPYVCGLSAGSSNAINYIARDADRTRRCFVEIVGDKRFGGFGSFVRHNGFFNSDFLYIEAIEDGTLPMDWEAYQANPTKLRIQSFERDTGRDVTWTRADTTDPLTTAALVRASSTMPFVMNPISLGGQVMLDGGLGTGAGIPVGMAEDDGLERVLLVATRPRGYRKKEPSARDEQMLKAASRDYPYLRKALLTRWERYNAALDHVEELAEQGRALVIYPDEMPVKNTTVNARRLAAAYDAGHAQYLREMPRVREFQVGSPDAGPRPDAPDQGTGYITLG